MTHCENDPRLFDRDLESTQHFLAAMASFRAFYAPVHGYICVVLCLFGVSSNLIHVVVLTRPSMRNSAVNSIMTWVALCDMGTMASYLVYICHFVLGQKLSESCTNGYTYLWMCFLLFHMFASITLHTTTLWLAVAMAFMRRMTLHAATLNSRWQGSRLACRISLAALLAVLALSTPTALVHRIVEYEEPWRAPAHCPDDGNRTEVIYTLNVAPSAAASGCFLFKANLWLTGALFKVIPCVLLIALSLSLLLKLRGAERKRQALLLNGGAGNDTNKRITSDRTTAMLLSILCVFLVTEFPQGVLSILSAVFTNDVHNLVYFMVGDLLDLLSLVNSSVNFVLYCLMSSRYRHTFCVTIMPLAMLRCNNANSPTTAGHYTNTEFNSRVQHVDSNHSPDRRRKSANAVRTPLRWSPNLEVRVPLSARPSRC